MSKDGLKSFVDANVEQNVNYLKELKSTHRFQMSATLHAWSIMAITH